jgi:hypothetical protein
VVSKHTSGSRIEEEYHRDCVELSISGREVCTLKKRRVEDVMESLASRNIIKASVSRLSDSRITNPESLSSLFLIVHRNPVNRVTRLKD